ncbi:hypothetical protein [Acidovorax sp. PRC11]|uniref:hypothetical protein n=1 Tax=Acidovorax sp. PRC11 TaxID=2962592 RepID=UPI002881C523|nr:hypothetical protein [Acidovorax sp. PRC11]MDT0140831.1 hypothetical protein [Acidovorax sp. PRC11]
MYFLTVKAGDEIVRDRTPFADYSEALAACGEYYEPRAAGAVLNFTSVVTGKKFMRSYAHLTRLADLGEVSRDSPQAVVAAKQSNAFSFSKSYAFLVESEDGVHEAERRAREDDE